MGFLEWDRIGLWFEIDGRHGLFSCACGWGRWSEPGGGSGAIWSAVAGHDVWSLSGRGAGVDGFAQRQSWGCQCRAGGRGGGDFRNPFRSTGGKPSSSFY